MYSWPSTLTGELDLPTSLSLVVLRSKKPLALSEAWAHFGLEFSQEQHGDGPVHYVSILGGVILEIYPNDGFQPATNGVRIGLVVGNLQKVLAGLPSDMKLLANEPSSTVRAVVSDAEGHKIELFERA